MRFVGVFVALILFAALRCTADSAEMRKVQVRLERWKDGRWTAVDPALVLERGERVRFQVTTNFDAFLYVVNYGTSGHSTTLYPGPVSSDNNQLVHGHGHSVPANGSDLRVAGPPGQDIIYWILSPVPLTGSARIPPGGEGRHPATLMPRCDDSLLRARGECIDSSAGPRDLTPEEGSSSSSREKAPDLTFLREDKNSVIAAPGNSPMIYEFRISHK